MTGAPLLVMLETVDRADLKRSIDFYGKEAVLCGETLSYQP